VQRRKQTSQLEAAFPTHLGKSRGFCVDDHAGIDGVGWHIICSSEQGGHVGKKMKFVLVLVTGLVGVWSAMAEHPEAPLNGSPIIKNYLDDWTTTWFVANWAAAGFETPQPNQPFRLSDYLEVIKSGVAREGDLCEFMHDAHLFIGLVKSVGYVADEFPCATELTAFVQLPVARTDQGIMCLCMAVEPPDIVGFLRPHKAPLNAPTPNSDPHFVYERERTIEWRGLVSR
jgi:hypothetical protein